MIELDEFSQLTIFQLIKFIISILTFLLTNKGNQFNIDYSLEELYSILKPKHYFKINRRIILNIQFIEKEGTYFNSRLLNSTKFSDNETKIVSR
jgi:hypothetical protein